MTLENWLKNDWLKEEPTSKEEIAGLLEIVDRDINQARIAEISPDWRLAMAHNAALHCATIALRAKGFRLSSDTGHHYYTIQSLLFTIRADGSLIRKLDSFRRKRNIVTYDSAGATTDDEIEEFILLASDLREKVINWLKAQYPELI